MKPKVFLLLILINLTAFGQWDNLKEFISSDFRAKAYLPQNSKPASGVNLEQGDLKNYNQLEPLAYVKINPKQTYDYILAFSPAPKGFLNPTFLFFSIDGKYIAEVKADKIYIPGNGNVYTITENFVYFPIHRKFVFRNNKLNEVQQPYYYVDFSTTTLKRITLYQDKNCTKILAVIPRGKPVKIIGQKPENSKVKLLIRSTFGLVGWFCAEEIENYFENVYFKAN